MVHIRSEIEQDHKSIFALNAAAFETDAEAKLVDVLREQAEPLVSLVAEDSGKIVGHILFTPVTICGFPTMKLMGLAPMAVLPRMQKKGIGSALVQAGLEKCREMRIDAVVVLGHPNYYPRFGFTPAQRFGLHCTYDVPPEVFMVLGLRTGALDEVEGVVQYHPIFDKL